MFGTQQQYHPLEFHGPSPSVESNHGSQCGSQYHQGNQPAMEYGDRLRGSWRLPAKAQRHIRCAQRSPNPRRSSPLYQSFCEAPWPLPTHSRKRFRRTHL